MNLAASFLSVFFKFIFLPTVRINIHKYKNIIGYEAPYLLPSPIK